MKNPVKGLSLILILCSIALFSCMTHKKGKGEIKSVLILGNSIVDHGPAPQIGWNGNWGMAASAEDSDFVHLLISEIKAKDSSVKFDYANLVGFEWELNTYPFARLDSFAKPDMMILRFSENVNDTTVNDGAFIRNYDKLIHYIDPDDKAIKVVVTGLWHRPRTHLLLKQYADEHKYIFVRNDDLQNDETNTAQGLFQDKGVAAHPSDKGMRKIKERIWEKIKAYF